MTARLLIGAGPGSEAVRLWFDGSEYRALGRWVQTLVFAWRRSSSVCSQPPLADSIRSVWVARALPAVGSVVGLAPSGVPVVRSLQGRSPGRWSFELQVKDEHSR